MTESAVPDGAFPRSLHRLLPPQYVDKLLASRGTVEGERRVVTILFSDVKGSTALAERLDPEVVLEIMNGAFEVLIEPITRHEGTLARLMGDAIMAFFGAPIAHEDDAARACHAALDIIEGVRGYAARLKQERGVEGFNVRVGLNTGLVVVAEVGSDLRVEYTAMGDAVNLAARMETAAEPGTILLTEATLNHVGHLFDTEPVGALQLKGKSEPVNSYRLLRPKSHHAGVDRPHATHSPLVGRRRELHELRSSLLALQKGAGGIVCISGDMGTGKSRLVQEARGDMTTLAWAETRSHPYTGGMSYQTIRQLLQSLLAEPGAASPTPYLSLLLGAPGAAGKPEAIVEDHSEEILPRVIQELREFLRSMASRRPHVLIWNDLHWIEPSSLSVLEGILHLVEEVPLLNLLLLRTEGDRMSLLTKRISKTFPLHHRKISLSRLSHADSDLLLDRLLKGRKVPREVQEKIIERTDGNPLFLEEVVRHLVWPGNPINNAESRLRGWEDALLSLPDTLRGAIMARIDSLPPQDRRTLQTASVLGRVFEADVLKAILPSVVSNWEVAQSLDELVRREFIVPLTSAGPMGDPLLRYAFTHSLTHEVAHESMLLVQRREFHGRAALAIRQSYRGDPSDLPEILAVHYEIAGEKDQAFQCLMEAAEKARSVFAHHEAISYYRRALKLAIEMDITGAMLRNLYEGLGDAYAVAAKYAAALEQFDQALALPQSARRRAALYRKKGQVLERTGQFDDALRSFKEALQILQAADDLPEWARVCSGLGRVYYLLGKHHISIELGNLAREMMERGGDSRGVALACNNLGLAYMKMGEREKALELFQHALAIWEERNDSVGLSATLNNLGQYHHQQGNYREAIEKYHQSIELCKQNGDRHGLASACDNLGQSLALDGRPEEANAYLARAVTILSDIGSESEEFEQDLWQRSGIW